MKKYTFAVALIGLVLGPVTVARADNVQVELQAVAKQVVELLKEQKTIKIGKFANKGNTSSFFGTEIQRVLAQELSRLKVTINADAKLEISGDYRPADKDPERPTEKETFVRINIQLVDTGTGEALSDLRITSRMIFGNEVLERVFAPTASIPPTADRKEENDILRKRIDKPAFAAKGSRILSKEDSPFSVEVLVVDDKGAADPKDGAPVEKTTEGQPFVTIKRGQFYRLRIHNNAKFDAAVKIGIDGLDQFVFCDQSMVVEKDGKKEEFRLRKDNGEPKYNYRIVRSGTSIVVSGWFRTLTDFDYFVVTEYAKSASAELRRDPNEAGQIALLFSACWEKDADKPADEPPPGGRDTADGTGRIPGGKANQKEVSVSVGVPRDIIGLRYGSTRP